jgi:hypothetical protein
MARLFKNLYQQVKETIEDDFIDPFDKKKIGNNVSLKIKSSLKTPCGLIKAEGSTHPNGSDVDGTIEPEFKFPDYDVVLKGKLQTNNNFEGTINFNNYLLKGTTWFETTKLNESGDTSLEAGVNYLNKDYGSFNFKLSSPIAFKGLESLDLYTAFVGYKSGFSLGGDVKLALKNFKSSACNAYLEYVKDDVSVALFGKYEKKGEDEKKTFGFGYHQNINEKIRGAVDFSLEHKSNTSTLRFGTNYKLDENSNLKSRLTLRNQTDMRLGFVLKQKLYPNTNLTLTSDLNTRLLHDNVSEGTPHQFGVTLSFFD